MKVWMDNKAKIERHNHLAVKGHKSYHLAMNKFGDLLHHEFTAMVNGYQARSKFNYTGTDAPVRGAKYLPPAYVDYLPENVDWRDLGAVTPIKDQGQVMITKCQHFAINLDPQRPPIFILVYCFACPSSHYHRDLNLKPLFSAGHAGASPQQAPWRR